VRFTFLELKMDCIPDTDFRPRAHSDFPIVYDSAVGKIETDCWSDVDNCTDVGLDSDYLDMSSESDEESTRPCLCLVGPPGVHCNSWQQCLLVPAVAVPPVHMQPGTLAREGSAQPSAATVSRRSPETEATAREKTTVMLRNLPNNFCRATLLQLFDNYGFAGKYDFVYLPIDFGRGANLGYCFVNLESNRVAEEFWRIFDRFGDWPGASHKVCAVTWSSCQGFSDNVTRYHNSPVMHSDVADAFQPALFQNGIRVPFPAPTESLVRPRMRGQRTAQ